MKGNERRGEERRGELEELGIQGVSGNGWEERVRGEEKRRNWGKRKGKDMRGR